MGKSQKPGTLSTPSARGGARAGAGRPTLGKTRTSVSLLPATLARALEIGDGNVSEGIERAISAFLENRQKRPVRR